jgi:chorismate-pyruvate lyase
MTDGHAVDVLNALARAQFAKPPGLGAVNLRALSPFQRALLVIDGTVTKFIEAYTLEPVDVHRLDQQEFLLAGHDEWLDAPAGTPVVARHVRIAGRYRRQLYVYAVALVVPDRLPGHLSERLLEEGSGIGRLLAEAGVETRREILWYGREHATELPAALGLGPRGEFNTRTYRIITGGRPVALINEKFPTGMDPLPVHE